MQRIPHCAESAVGSEDKRRLHCFQRIGFYVFKRNEGVFQVHVGAAVVEEKLHVGKRCSDVVEAYETLHPGLYRYNSKEQMGTHFQMLAEEFRQDRTLVEAYLAISIFLAKIKCGHTYANFYNQDKSVVEALFKHPDRLPFYFRWLRKRMIITRSFAENPALTPGTEVLAVDDVPVADILDRLMTITRADGSNDAKRVSLLEVQGTDEWPTFDIFFSLFFPTKKATRKLEIKNAQSGTVSTLEVRALSPDERFAPLKAAREAEKGDGPVWSIDYVDKQYALLRMRTFALYKSKWDWKGYLDQTFADLEKRGVKNLILDIRGNEGGLDVGEVLAQKLGGPNVRRSAYQRLVRYRKTPSALDKYLDTWDPSFKDWGDDAVPFKEGFFRLKDEPREKSVAKRAAFRGKTFVLIEATNSSAAFQFAQMVRENKLGRLVGSPTGGNQRGINGGAFFFLRLPHSKIEVDLPLIGRFLDHEVPDAGIEPDVVVEPNIADIMAGRDSELEAVKKEISATQGR